VKPHNIAVNSLWPATIIETQASINHALGNAGEVAQSPTSSSMRAAAGEQEPGAITVRR